MMCLGGDKGLFSTPSPNLPNNKFGSIKIKGNLNPCLT